jgi:hypothetical protein
MAMPWREVRVNEVMIDACHLGLAKVRQSGCRRDMAIVSHWRACGAQPRQAVVANAETVQGVTHGF